MKLRIVIPTIDGRKEHLARCLRAYEQTAPEAEVIVIHNKPTCGVAWQEGADMPGDYDLLHFTADDLVPHEGWLEAALSIVENGNIPAPCQLDSNGDVVGAIGPTGTETRMSTIPFCTHEQWQQIGPMVDWHYYTDDYFSERAKRAGMKVIFHNDYKFTHNFAQVGRGAGMSESGRMHQDMLAYEAWANTSQN